MAVQLTLEQCQTCIQRCCAVLPRELKHPQQPLVKVTLHGALMLQAHCCPQSLSGQHGALPAAQCGV